MTATAARRLRDHLTSRRFTYNTENDLQLAIDAFLTQEATLGHPVTLVEREYRLDPHNRIDFLVTMRTGLDRPPVRVGIEIKVGGALAAVHRQLTRYAAFPAIDELLLVTNRASHHGIPAEVGGKPVVLCSLVEAGL